MKTLFTRTWLAAGSCLLLLPALGQTTPTPPGGCDPLATAPRPRPDQLATPIGTAVTFSSAALVANDTDPLGRPLRAVSVDKPAVGTVTTHADGTFTYAPPPGFAGVVELTYFVQGTEPVLASRATGHYYEFVADSGACWPAARAAAAGRTYQGMRGYLATITTQEEQALLANRRSRPYWLGATDQAAEGEWRWQTGPEAGQLIWQGAAGGYGLAYTNWSAGQPDDYHNPYHPQGEDYGVMYASGQWNDLDACGTGTAIGGYLVEYGGLEPCLPVLFALGRLTITVGPPSALASAPGTPGAAPALAAYPNPSDGQFQVRLLAPAAGPARLDLFDTQGQRVRSLFAGQLAAGQAREISVDGTGLAPGLYLLRLAGSTYAQTLRVSIQ